MYRAVADRAPEAEVIIPPRCTGKRGARADQAPTRRDRHIQTRSTRAHRLTAGDRLWSPIVGRDGDVSLPDPDRQEPARPKSAWTEGRGPNVLCGPQSDDSSRHTGLLPRRLRTRENQGLPGQHAAIRYFCTNAHQRPPTPTNAARTDTHVNCVAVDPTYKGESSCRNFKMIR